MYNCAQCGKQCTFHRHYQSHDDGKVTSIVTNTPTYHMTMDNNFIPFCSCQCGTDYYTNNIRNNTKLVIKQGKYETVDAKRTTIPGN